MEVASFMSKMLASFSKHNNREKSIVIVLPYGIGPTNPLVWRIGASKAALILMKNSHFDRTLQYPSFLVEGKRQAGSSHLNEKFSLE